MRRRRTIDLVRRLKVAAARTMSAAIVTMRLIVAFAFAISLYTAALGTGVYLHEYRRTSGLP